MKFKKDKKKWKDFLNQNPKREENIRLPKVEVERRAMQQKKREDHKAKYFWKHMDLDAD